MSEHELEFDIATISQILQEKNLVFMNLRRRDRKLVELEIRTFPKNHDLMNIWAYSEDDFGYKTIYAISKINKTGSASRNTQLIVFLNEVYEKINDYTECQYCDTPHKRNLSMCDECFEFGCILKREQCIICLESKHATKFKCYTCIDSIVCLKCGMDPRWSNICPTCKKPEQIFGRGKKRSCPDSSDSD
jgi:hypothetical protein